MKRRYGLFLAAALALTACDKQEAAEPAAEEPASEQPVDEKAPEEGAAAQPEDAPAEEQVTVATVGKPAPDFELVDETGKKHKLSDHKGKIVVLEWMSPECPVVRRVYDSEIMQKTIAAVGDDVVWLTIDSSHFNTPEESQKWKASHKLEKPILQDPSGAIGQVYEAKTTPQMYVIDKEGILRYNGAIDDDPHGKKDAADQKNFVIEAVNAVKAGEEVAEKETKPYGCSVKYKS